MASEPAAPEQHERAKPARRRRLVIPARERNALVGVLLFVVIGCAGIYVVAKVAGVRDGTTLAALLIVPALLYLLLSGRVSDLRGPGGLEVQLFGSFVLHREGQLVTKASRKDRARELAALLILNPKGLSDDIIAEYMFPEMPREGALHNLQMAAYSLRKDLGSSSIHSWCWLPTCANSTRRSLGHAAPLGARSFRLSQVWSSCIVAHCWPTPPGTGSTRCGSNTARATSPRRCSWPTCLPLSIWRARTV